MSTNFNILEINSDNVHEHGVYCIKNKKAPGYKKKLVWFEDQLNSGLKLLVAVDQQEKQVGFVELIPSEKAWRPVLADNYYFVQCLAFLTKSAQKQGGATTLLEACEAEAKKAGKSGICAITSEGVWMAGKSIFEKNGFECVESKDRFDLMVKKLSTDATTPKFSDWEKELKQLYGWHLIYSDQCPFHEKSIKELHTAAELNGIDLQIRRIKTPQEAQFAPSGFGTFTVVRDGKLLADHYISQTRFKNILKKELGITPV